MPLHLDLLRQLLLDTEWPDAHTLVDNLAAGFRLTGEVPVSHEARPGIAREAVHARDELLRQAATLRPALASRQAQPPAAGEQAVDAAEVFRQTLAEIALGRMGPLHPLDLRSGLPLTRRFAVRQMTPSGTFKTRCIDDFAESRINDACRVNGRLRMDRLEDVRWSVAASMDALGTSWLLAKSDVRAAYRLCPVAAADLELASVAVHDPWPSPGSTLCRSGLSRPFTPGIASGVPLLTWHGPFC